MTHRVVTSRVEHRHNVELINIAPKNHPNDKITVVIKS